MNVETQIKLNKFKPRSYQLPIIDALENKGYRRILAIMPRRCLSGRTHIVMADGSYKELRFIQEGDRILSWDGERFVEDRVKSVWATGLKKTKALRSTINPTLISSYDHKFATIDSKSDDIEWSHLDGFHKNEIVVAYAGFLGDGVRSREVTALESEFLGYCVSSMCRITNERLIFSTEKRELLERIADVIDQLFGCNASWREYRQLFSMFYTSTVERNYPLFAYINDYGLGEYTRDNRLPKSYWYINTNCLLGILRGLILADGRIDTYKTTYLPDSLDFGADKHGSIEVLINICRVSSIHWDLYWLSRKCGLSPSVPFVGEQNKLQIAFSKTYDVQNLLLDGDYHWLNKNKQLALDRIEKFGSDKREWWKSCLKIIPEIVHNEPEELYDLETETNGNFLANGYLVHNSGKDITAFNLCIRQCLRTPCVVYYIFPTYSQAKKVIWDSITNEGMRILDFIPPEVISSSNSQEMKIRFINGSLLQLVGSDNYDSLVGTNPRGVVFSEYALQDPRAYQFIRPILTANDGWALFLSCVVGNTLVITDNGMERIDKIIESKSEYTSLNLNVYGLGGKHNATEFYNGGIQPTLKIKTMLGYSIECTPIHPLWDGEQWKQAKEFKVGNLLPLQYGQCSFGTSNPPRIPQELAHIGLESFLSLLGILWTVMQVTDDAIIIDCPYDLLHENVKRADFLVRNGNQLMIYSHDLIDLVLEYGIVEHDMIPSQVLQLNKSLICCFLRGVFDVLAVPLCDKKYRGNIILGYSNLAALRDIQVVLLNLGILSQIVRRSSRESGISLVNNAGMSYDYELRIRPRSLNTFYSEIGFTSKKFQWHWRYVPSCLPFEKFPQESFYYDIIESIEESQAPVYDFVIPDTHSFFSNGFISHNTPRGKNHLWELYQIAQQSPLWYCYKLTVDDTQHIPMSEIEKERMEGIMSEDLIQQEYWTSFTMGVEGAYYAKYIDKLRVNGQISQVPWEIGFKVHTAWDLGVRDSTTIIFFQVIGQTVRIIDCYENSKEGLEHYISVLKEKPYIYGKHIAPHDIRVREFTSGITRIEKARQLGISFTIAPDLSLIDGIEAVRTTLPKCWFDSVKCASLIKALENYRQEYDAKRKIYKDHPLHDYASHFSDAMRYLAISLPKTSDGMTADDAEKMYRSAYYGNDSTLPSVFRNDLL